MKRHPSVILATAVLPWDADLRLDTPRFRRQIRFLVNELTPYIYIFGTAGEGYAVDDALYDETVDCFASTMVDCGAIPMVGLISQSLRTIQGRLERARARGISRFQISLPNWSVCSELEVERFFAETCGRYPDCAFLLYNLRRAGRLIEPDELGRLAARHPNLVAVKTGSDNRQWLVDSMAAAPDLQFFVTEMAYAELRDEHEIGLLISLALTHPQAARRFFQARGSALAAARPGLAAVLDAVLASAPQPRVDGAYDKLLYGLHDPGFPTRLLPPYSSATPAQALAFRRAMPAAWLPWRTADRSASGRISWIVATRPEDAKPLLALPRLVALGDRLLCSYTKQSKLGINNFVPCLCESRDGGETWSAPRELWPERVDQESVLGSISRGPDGTLYFYGSRTPIDVAGESFWDESNWGLKANRLFLSRSTDGGRSWTTPGDLDVLQEGAAEVPGPLLAAGDGSLHAVYAPYNIAGAGESSDHAQVLHLRSRDGGRSWSSQTLMRFAAANDFGAEAWIIELAPGRLVASAWQNTHAADAPVHPTPLALSEDGGDTWRLLQSGIPGQTTSLNPLGYNRFHLTTVRRGDAATDGIWVSTLRIRDGGLVLEDDVRIWAASAGEGQVAAHADWTRYAYGEPALLLREGHAEALLAFWYAGADGTGVRQVRLPTTHLTGS